MKHSLKKATSILLAALTTLMVCLQPVRMPDTQNEPEMSIYEATNTEITLPSNPGSPRPR